MANTKSAEKAARQAVKHRTNNVASRSRACAAPSASPSKPPLGQQGPAPRRFKDAAPIIDAMVNKGLIHRNKAARHKSRLAAHAKAAVSKA